jgi:hypothetical protein
MTKKTENQHLRPAFLAAVNLSSAAQNCSTAVLSRWRLCFSLLTWWCAGGKKNLNRWPPGLGLGRRYLQYLDVPRLDRVGQLRIVKLEEESLGCTTPISIDLKKVCFTQVGHVGTVLLEKSSTGEDHFQSLNCHAGPMANTATTRFLPANEPTGVSMNP